MSDTRTSAHQLQPKNLSNLFDDSLSFGEDAAGNLLKGVPISSPQPVVTTWSVWKFWSSKTEIRAIMAARRFRWPSINRQFAEDYKGNKWHFEIGQTFHIDWNSIICQIAYFKLVSIWNFQMKLVNDSKVNCFDWYGDFSIFKVIIEFIFILKKNWLQISKNRWKR